MFNSLEPDANDNPISPGDGSPPFLPETEAKGQGIRPLPQPLNPEKVRHLLYGSLAALDRTIKILHAYGHADPNDWSDPIPVPPSFEKGCPRSDLPLRDSKNADF